MAAAVYSTSSVGRHAHSPALLKMFDYSSVSAGQDSDNSELSPHGVRLSQLAFMRQQRAVLMASAAASAVSMAHAPTLTTKEGETLPSACVVVDHHATDTAAR